MTQSKTRRFAEDKIKSEIENYRKELQGTRHSEVKTGDKVAYLGSRLSQVMSIVPVLGQVGNALGLASTIKDDISKNKKEELILKKNFYLDKYGDKLVSRIMDTKTVKDALAKGDREVISSSIGHLFSSKHFKKYLEDKINDKHLNKDYKQFEKNFEQHNRQKEKTGKEIIKELRSIDLKSRSASRNTKSKRNMHKVNEYSTVKKDRSRGM